jgi:cell division protein FtsB
LLKPIVITIFMATLLGACSSSLTDPAAKQKEDAELAERCKELQEDIEDLKGRPVRRSAAREYYANECMPSL